MIFVHDIVRVSSAATRYLAAKKQKIDIDKSIGNMNPNESVEESNRCFSESRKSPKKSHESDARDSQDGKCYISYNPHFCHCLLVASPAVVTCNRTSLVARTRDCNYEIQQ